MRRSVFAAFVMVLGCLSVLAGQARAAGPNVLLVGTYNGVTGPYTTIQQAVDAAQPGDWVLVGPGVYHERGDYTEAGNPPAGVVIRTPGIHLRGMVRGNIAPGSTPSSTGVVIDGTKPGSPVCSSNPSDQDYGPNNQGRNGIEVFGQTGGADDVTIDNLFICNFLTSAGGANGNQVWWNGGDGGGAIHMHGYEGSYLTATSLYANADPANTLGGACCGVNYPAGSYGIFSSDATKATDNTFATWTNDYASNMADSSFYIGACQQRCDVIMSNDHGQGSSLCISTTNAGGYLLVDHMTCDQNKTGPVSNAQNNDDWPSPQIGYCSSDPTEPQVGATGTNSCTVWQNSNFSNNNNPNVPGNGTSGLAGGGPVGTGLILAATRGITLYHNTIENNNSWGELIVDLPDQEAGPANCNGGILVSPPSQTPVCYFPSGGNVSLDNTFLNNGSGYGVPNGSLVDIGMATAPHTNPPFDITVGNCFAGDTDAGKPLNAPTTDPPGLETLPVYAPSNGVCTQSNSGDVGPLLAQAECAAQLLAPCPTLNTLCLYNPNVPCVPVPTPLDYPRPTVPFTLAVPPVQATMPNPCAGVPANGFCGTLPAAVPEVPLVILPALTTAAVIGGAAYVRRRRGRSPATA